MDVQEKVEYNKDMCDVCYLAMDLMDEVDIHVRN